MLTLDRVLEVVREHVREESGNSRVDTIDAETKLLQAGLVDSFGIVVLAEKVSEVFKLDPDRGQLVPEDFQTPRALFERLKRMLGEEPAPEARDDEPPPLVRTDVASGSLYSYWQDIIATWERTRGASPLWTRPVFVRLKGPLDRAILERAIRRILERQESLRQLFERDPKARPGLCSPESVSIRHVAMRGSTDAAVEEFYLAELARPFLLDGTPLLRFILVERSDEEHALLIYYHQLVHDATRPALLVEEILEAYGALMERRPERLEPLRIRYVDFAAWERAYFEGPGRRKVEEARQYLANAKPLDLPRDLPPGARPGSISSRYTVPIETSERFTKMCEEHGTVFAGFSVVLALLLKRWCETDDPLFYTPVNTRWRPEFKNLCGRFGSILPIRLSLAGDLTVGELIRRESTESGGVRRFEAPPSQLVYGTEDVFAHPLISVALNLPGVTTGGESASISLAGVTAEVLPPPLTTQTRTDLALLVVNRGGSYGGVILAKSELFSPSTLERWARELESLVTSIRDTARVSELV
jgi:hypothetical protein